MYSRADHCKRHMCLRNLTGKCFSLFNIRYTLEVLYKRYSIYATLPRSALYKQVALLLRDKVNQSTAPGIAGELGQQMPL